jgi:hypothetical protein
MSEVDYATATDGTKVISEDPWLRPFEHVLKQRYVCCNSDFMAVFFEKLNQLSVSEHIRASFC